jgi:hypothetical protein
MRSKVSAGGGDGIHALQSGLALTATLGGSTVLNLGGERRARPNLIGNPELPESQRTVQQWFNTKAFAQFNPSPQAFGNAGVGIMRGPGYVSFDFTLGKSFHIDEVRRVEFRAESSMPSTGRTSTAGMGRKQGSAILSAGNARIMQFGLCPFLVPSSEF